MPTEAARTLRARALAVGKTASRSVTFTDEIVTAFCAATGDNNPVHLSDEFAAATRFGRRIVNGMLTCALVSSVIGTQLPGPGTIYLSQTFTFVAPVFIGDEVTATVSVLHIREDRPILRLGTICRKADGEVVLDGEATVLIDSEHGSGG
jgi:3-hydroxybutyryl-CoA dehydratase